MAEYNGHPSWTLWNVSLWVGNDEGLYNLARECIRHSPNRAAAAERMLSSLQDTETDKTPDGANYTKTSLRYAMRGL